MRPLGKQAFDAVIIVFIQRDAGCGAALRRLRGRILLRFFLRQLLATGFFFARFALFFFVFLLTGALGCFISRQHGRGRHVIRTMHPAGRRSRTGGNARALHRCGQPQFLRARCHRHGRRKRFLLALGHTSGHHACKHNNIQRHQNAKEPFHRFSTQLSKP